MKAVSDSVPSAFCEINLKAFKQGYEYGSTAQAVAPASLEMEPHLIYSED
jgi:Pyruvate/2-oxoacid:ferredoxin oxidoreductase gamma subunit